MKKPHWIEWARSLQAISQTGFHFSDYGRWTLPGGWADVNETPSQATVREVFEESGFETKVVKLLAVYDREKQGHIPPFPF